MKCIPSLILLLLVSCHSGAEDHEKNLQTELKKEIQSIQDPGIESKGDSRFMDSISADFNLHSLLESAQFMNNGGTETSYSFTPNRKGFHYMYFFANTNLRNGLELKTYIFGNKVGQYNKQNECFIEIICRENHVSLGRMNLIGAKTKLFLNRPSLVFKNENYIVLQENEKLLLLNHQSDSIRWFKYTRVKNDFEKLTENEKKSLFSSTHW